VHSRTLGIFQWNGVRRSSHRKQRNFGARLERSGLGRLNFDIEEPGMVLIECEGRHPQYGKAWLPKDVQGSTHNNFPK